MLPLANSASKSMETILITKALDLVSQREQRIVYQNQAKKIPIIRNQISFFPSPCFSFSMTVLCIQILIFPVFKCWYSQIMLFIHLAVCCFFENNNNLKKYIAEEQFCRQNKIYSHHLMNGSRLLKKPRNKTEHLYYLLLIK